MAVLEVDDLVSFYDKVEVVSHVSLAAAAGETVALVGRNGAGKTALMRTIMGHAPPMRRQGRVRLEGQDITGLPPHEIARRGIGMAPDNHQIFPHLTVEENLILAQKLIDRRRRPRSLDEIYALFPQLDDLSQRSGAVLSGGERKLLAIARAIVQRPAMLLLDETSEGLSPVLVQQLIEVLKRLQGERITMLIADQNLRFCSRIAARAYVLERGRIQFAGTFDELWRQAEANRMTLMP